MKRRISMLISLLLIMSMILSGCANTSNGNENGVKSTTIQIIHLNDTHSRVIEEENTGIGYAKVATLVKDLRKENENTLVMDAGDTFHGQTIANLVEGESIVQIMNGIGYDYMVPGNHDFNFGYKRLKELEGLAKFKILAANIAYIKDNKEFMPRYDIKEIDGVRLGIFGLSTPETVYKTHPDNVKSLRFDDPIKVAKEMVSMLEKESDFIICIGHIGVDESSEFTSKKICEAVSGIDLFVDGHSHTTLDKGITTNTGTLIVQTGEYDKNLGVVTLEFKGSENTSKKARLISKESAKDVKPDPEIDKIVSDIRKEQDKILSEVVGYTDTMLQGDREYVRTSQTNLGTLIAESMIWATGADIAITNGGGIRASIDKGEITKGEIISVLPFGNFIVTTKIKGSDVVEMLYHGTNSYPEPDGRFPQVGNISYSIDDNKTVKDRILDIKVKGEPIDMEKEYIIAVKDFIYAGGDGYDMFTSEIINEYSSLSETLIKYLGEKNKKKE